MPQLEAEAQRTGQPDGGGVLDQSVLTIPLFDSWKDTVPAVWTASSGLSAPSVVHARVNDVPLLDLTVTFSVVGASE